jgi:hypothetical protein
MRQALANNAPLAAELPRQLYHGAEGLFLAGVSLRGVFEIFARAACGWAFQHDEDFDIAARRLSPAR